jgi:hypothetical protein
MAASLADQVLDNGLTYLHTNTTHVTILSSATEPTTYAQASATFLLAYKSWGANNAVGASGAGSPNGRQVATTAITDGTVTTTGTANWWGLCDETNSILLAHGSLSASQVVTAGNTFSLASFNIRIPNQ